MIDIYMTHDLHQSLKHILHRDSEKSDNYIWIGRKPPWVSVYIKSQGILETNSLYKRRTTTMNCAFYQDLEMVPRKTVGEPHAERPITYI